MEFFLDSMEELFTLSDPLLLIGAGLLALREVRASFRRRWPNVFSREGLPRSVSKDVLAMGVVGATGLVCFLANMGCVAGCPAEPFRSILDFLGVLWLFGFCYLLIASATGILRYVRGGIRKLVEALSSR